MSTYPNIRTLMHRGAYSSFELALILAQPGQWQEWPAAYHAWDTLPTWHGDMGRRTPLEVPHVIYHGNGRIEAREGITAAALARLLDRWALEARRYGGYLVVPVLGEQERVGSFLIQPGEMLWQAERRAELCRVG